MKTAITLSMAVAGLIMLGLDRILPKEKVLALDRNLTHFTQRFRPLDWKKLILIFLFLVTTYQFYVLVRTAPSNIHIALLIGSTSVIVVIALIAWILFGGLIAYNEWQNPSARQSKLSSCLRTNLDAAPLPCRLGK